MFTEERWLHPRFGFFLLNLFFGVALRQIWMRGTGPGPFKSSLFPPLQHPGGMCWTSGQRRRLDGYSRIAVTQRSSGELSGGPDGEQLPCTWWKARSAQRQRSSDLLHLLGRKWSQKVFISRQTRLWPHSYTALDLRIADKNLRAGWTCAVEPGFFHSCTVSYLWISP